VIVWGGTDGITPFGDGARYDPAAGSWKAVPSVTAPAARYSHTAVWTGSTMVVWGGFNGGFLNDGASYYPAEKNWTTVGMTDAPAGRMNHTAVWTGTEMIVWGGDPGCFPLEDGGRYDPVLRSWRRMSATDAPSGFLGHTGVWTGNELIIWGGYDCSESDPNIGVGGRYDGGRYNPASDHWSAMTLAGAPAARVGHSAVWTGSEMITWGGMNLRPAGRPSGSFNDTFSYTPDSNVFRILSAVRNGDRLFLRFSTVPDCTYTLWRSDSLTDGAWVNTGLPAVTGTGAILEFTVPAAAATRGFFRVRADAP
jgi:hypothetical protein